MELCAGYIEKAVLIENENLASSLAILSRHIGNVEKENPQ